MSYLDCDVKDYREIDFDTFFGMIVHEIACKDFERKDFKLLTVGRPGAGRCGFMYDITGHGIVCNYALDKDLVYFCMHLDRLLKDPVSRSKVLLFLHQAVVAPVDELDEYPVAVHRRNYTMGESSIDEYCYDKQRPNALSRANALDHCIGLFGISKRDGPHVPRHKHVFHRRNKFLWRKLMRTRINCQIGCIVVRLWGHSFFNENRSPQGKDEDGLFKYDEHGNVIFQSLNYHYGNGCAGSADSCFVSVLRALKDGATNFGQQYYFSHFYHQDLRQYVGIVVKFRTDVVGCNVQYTPITKHRAWLENELLTGCNDTHRRDYRWLMDIESKAEAESAIDHMAYRLDCHLRDFMFFDKFCSLRGLSYANRFRKFFYDNDDIKNVLVVKRVNGFHEMSSCYNTRDSLVYNILSGGGVMLFRSSVHARVGCKGKKCALPEHRNEVMSLTNLALQAAGDQLIKSFFSLIPSKVSVVRSCESIVQVSVNAGVRPNRRIEQKYVGESFLLSVLTPENTDWMVQPIHHIREHGLNEYDWPYGEHDGTVLDNPMRPNDGEVPIVHKLPSLKDLYPVRERMVTDACNPEGGVVHYYK